ncbi:MAG: hypothetical protein MUE49_05960 [Rhodospirillales bacterium]|nr:hypothetical protein [Rhodospirillales bacterium]
MAAQILVVDDEPDLELLVRQKFRRHIRDGAYQFLFAHDGEEALAIIGDRFRLWRYEEHPHRDEPWRLRLRHQAD